MDAASGNGLTYEDDGVEIVRLLEHLFYALYTIKDSLARNLTSFE